MFARLRGLLRQGPVRGVVASLAVHGLLVVLALVLTAPVARYTVKRGEPLFIELPELPEPPPAGNPAARRSGPSAPKVVTPRQAAPRAQPQAVSPSTAQATPRPVSPPSQPAVVAARSAPPAPAPQPVPEPKAADGVDAPRPPSPERPAASPEPVPEPSAAVQTPAPSPTPSPATPPPPESPGPQVAALPPDGAVDSRAALGRGAAAGSAKGGGRGGIEGEPIPLDSPNPKYDDFLDRLRRRIKANWGYPCIKNDTTRACDYMTASLVVEFGILKDGRLQFVEVVKSSGFPIYDDYAVNAIKLSSPFPAVPPSMIIAMKQGSTGVAILARFHYIVETSLTNLLR